MSTASQGIFSSPFTQPSNNAISGNISGIGANGIAATRFQAPTALNSLTDSLKAPSTSNVVQALLGQGSLVQPTASGGVAFHPSMAAGYSKPAQTSQDVVDNSGGTSNPNYSYNAGVPQSGASGLAQYTYSNSSTPGGGNLTMNANGSPVGYAPSAGYSIDTSSSAPVSALGNNTYAGLQNSHNSYSDYVNALSQAQGYSPQYIQALQGQQGAQLQGAQLGLDSATLNSNLYTGNNLPGDTLSYAQGATAKAQAQNTLEQSQNSIQQLGANQALNTAQLARTGNISAAQTQLQYSPEGMAGHNSIDQYNALQQQYPAAAIPAYNPALSPETNQQNAQELVANSPAYRSQFQSTYTTPGGGTGIYNKLDLSGLQQNQDGNYQLVSGAAAALGSAQAGVVNNSLSNLSKINSAIESSTKTLSTTQQFMNQYGLNQTGVPIITQIQNAAGKQIPDKAGAIAALNVDLNTLRSDYSQFLIGRGGSVAGTGPDSAEVTNAIPNNASPAQLQQIVQQMQQGGENTATAVNNQIQQALSGITNNSVQSTSSNGTSATGGGWGSLGD